MNRLLPLILLIALLHGACNSGTRSVFAKKTPHEKYAEKLEVKDLDKSPEGRAWLAASTIALTKPNVVGIPYSLRGYFHTDKPRAIGLQFQVKAGEQLRFTLAKDQTTSFVLYADFYEQEGTTQKHLFAVDTNTAAFIFDAPHSGTYILRIQPELSRTGAYNLSVAVGPSIEFPVSDKKARVGSVWGDARDGGKRSHEGIDIFAPKGTAAIAAADGRITSVKEGGIGGKTVWLRPDGKNYTLYYAHLDEQLVQEGQSVKRGDVVGTVGNTGNARTTPAHLHFGIYGYGGPIDPMPFVARGLKTPPAIPEKELIGYLQLTKSIKNERGVSVATGSKLVPVGVSARGYLTELPEGSYITVPFNGVKLLKEVPKPVQSVAATPPSTNRRS